MWLRLVVHSSTNVDALFSFDGMLYTPRVVGNNPGFTIARYGVCLAGNTGGGQAEAVFDLPVAA